MACDVLHVLVLIKLGMLFDAPPPRGPYTDPRCPRSLRFSNHCVACDVLRAGGDEEDEAESHASAAAAGGHGSDTHVNTEVCANPLRPRYVSAPRVKCFL